MEVDAVLTAERRRVRDGMPDCADLFRRISLGFVRRAANTTVLRSNSRARLLRPERNETGRPHATACRSLLDCEAAFVLRQQLRYVRFSDDFPYVALTNIWTDTRTELQR